MEVRCNGANGCPAESPKAELNVSRAVLHLDDSLPPSVSSSSGSLAADGAHSGVDSVTFTASDRGAGLYQTLVEVDGQARPAEMVDTNGGRCVAQPDGAFSYRVPCKLSATVTASVDTRQLSEGEHAVRVRVRDAAGNVTTVLGPKRILVDNVPLPAATVAPSVSGSARQGETLSADVGTWTNAVGEAQVQWLRCDGAGQECTDISGPEARQAQYRLQAADVGARLRVAVTRRNSAGEWSAPVRSSATPGVQAAAEEVRGPIVVPQQPAPAGPTGPSGPTGRPGDDGAPGRDGAQAKPPTGNGANGGAGARLSAVFSSKQRSLNVAYGKRVLITGRLLGPSGRPVIGARLEVLDRVRLLGAAMVPAGSVTTDRDGTFRYVAPVGASRTIRFAYRAHLEDTEFAEQQDVELGVVAGVALKVNRPRLRNGQTVTFRGRVHGAPRGSRKVVELQVRKGRGWMTFRSTRLRAGRFTERYRFTRSFGVKRYEFRARVRAEDGFPFLSGSSPSRRVTVRG